MPAGIYIHIPFCLGKCPYCDFYSVEKDDELIDEFVDALLAEIQIIANTKWKNRVYNTVFIGGGTPPLIGLTGIEATLRALRGNFNISPRAEISMEVNPETASVDFLKTIRSFGVNRISIGAQAFDDEILKTLGRIHNSAAAARAIDDAATAGYERLCLDLIFGVPGQTVEIWRDTLWQAINKNPVHVSAYGLTIERGTPYEKRVESGKLVLPDNDTQAEMYQAMHQVLTDSGFGRYEVSNYSRMGYECQHNLKYWRDDKYLGLGPSAHSYDGDSRSANYKNLGKYITSIRKGRRAVNFKEKLNDRQRAEERLLLGLRLTEGIDYNIVKDVINEEMLRELKKQKYITKKLNNLVLTDSGFLVADEIIVKLLKSEK
jgi:oxygen-independent coproporphyrinogen-3 oxidase